MEQEQQQQPQSRIHTSVGGWVAASRPYSYPGEDGEEDEMISDDGGIDLDEDIVVSH